MPTGPVYLKKNAKKNEDANAIQKKPIAKVALGLLACAVVTAAWFAFAPAGKSAKSASAPAKSSRLVKSAKPRVQSGKIAVSNALASAKLPDQPKRKHYKLVKSWDFSHLKGQDRNWAEKLQRALDDNDESRVLAAAEKALASDNPEVRRDAVEALGWIGVKALPELTMAMADKDEDIASAALNHWEMAVDNLGDAGDKFNVTAAAFASLSNEDALTSLGGIMSAAALEIIDGEEDEAKQMEKRVDVVQSLLDVIEGEGKMSAKAAEEVYRDITGNEWLGVEEAEKYLQNPDEYEAPETDDDK